MECCIHNIKPESLHIQRREELDYTDVLSADWRILLALWLEYSNKVNVEQ